MREGWICPRCKTINAPFAFQCTCKEEVEYTQKLSNLSECQQGNHQWECCGISTAGVTYRCEICGKTKTENYDVDKSNITISSQ